MNLIVADDLIGKQLEAVTLLHPRTGNDCLFLKCEESVYEVVKFSREIGCLFVGDVVVPDASLNLVSAVDSLFLLLPQFVKNQKQFKTLNDIFQDESEFLTLLARNSISRIVDICETKEIDGETFYRLSSSPKTMDWLQSKIDALVVVLDRKSISTSTKSVGVSQLKFLGKEDSSRGDKVRYAFGLLEDYLPPNVALDLQKHLNIAESVTLPQAESSGDAGNGSKDPPKEDYFIDSKYGMKQEEKKLTRSQKQLAKVDKTGMKPLSAFFKPKPK